MPRKTTFVLFVAALLSFGVSAANAQETARSFSVFIAPEVSTIATPEAVTDYYSIGFGISVGIEFSISTQWSLVAAAGAKYFTPDKGMIEDWWGDAGEHPDATDVEISEGALGAVTMSLVSKGSLRKEDTKTYPYIKGGFGISYSGADDVHIEWTEADTDMADDKLGLDSGAHISILFGIGLEKKFGEGHGGFFIEFLPQLIVQQKDGTDYNSLMLPLAVGLTF